MRTWVALVTWLMTSVAASAAPATQSATEAVIGLALKEFDQTIRSAYREAKTPLPDEIGLCVTAASKNGPADIAGIKPANVVIVKKSGKPIATMDAWDEWRKSLKVGTPVTLDVWQLDTNRFGSLVWKKATVKVTPITRLQMEDDALRASYLQLDSGWVKIPEGLAVDVKSSTKMKSLKVGETGTVDSCRVFQVLKDGTFIATLAVDGEEREARMLGVSTDGLVDGKYIQLPNPIGILQTWTYDTAAGSSRTIFLAASLTAIRRGLSDQDLAELKSWLQKHDSKPQH